MLRMHTRTLELVEGSLIAMMGVCMPQRLGEDDINGRVYMVASHSTCVSHAGVQTSSYPKTRCRHGYESSKMRLVRHSSRSGTSLIRGSAVVLRVRHQSDMSPWRSDR